MQEYLKKYQPKHLDLVIVKSLAFFKTWKESRVDYIALRPWAAPPTRNFSMGVPGTITALSEEYSTAISQTAVGVWSSLVG